MPRHRSGWLPRLVVRQWPAAVFVAADVTLALTLKVTGVS